MRSEKLYDALTDVDEALVEESVSSGEKPRKKTKGLRWISAVAAILAVVILLTAVLRPGSESGATACALETPAYPASAPYPDVSSLLSGGDIDEDALQTAYEAWSEVQEQRRDARLSYAVSDFADYLTAAIPAFLGGRDGENVACSPLNLYLALAALAETTDGASRAQILSLLGSEDMDDLRGKAKNLFLANYTNDGASKSLPAAALWLRDDMDYHAETVKRLAEHCFAASFRGTMGSKAYDGLLRQWINEQTGNQLEDQTEGMSFDSKTVMAITTTLDFSAQWETEFRPERTTDSVFYSKTGELPCRMMHQDETNYYSWGDQFGALRLRLKDDSRMCFLLPDEGVTPEALLRDPEAISFLLTAGNVLWENSKSLVVHLAMPKFDVSSQLSMEQTLQELGLTDVFDPDAADFTPLTDASGVYLSEVRHGARVAVDEEGVTASAVTMLLGAGAAMPPDEEMDFTLDRPFLFAICGADGLPLFVGIVNQP